MSLWRPHLDDRDVIAVVDRCLDDLRSPPPAWLPPGATPENARHIQASLAGGAGGLGILFLHAARAFPDRDYADTGLGFLEEAVDRSPESGSNPGLFSGATGVAWALEYAAKLFPELIGEEFEAVCERVDESLIERLGRSPWGLDFDLVGGLVGMGVYALERLPRVAARESLERIVRHLSALAEPSGGGLTWWTPPELLPGDRLSAYPDGYYDLGLAHGVPGVLAWLARVHARGIAIEECSQLLEGGVNWLIGQHRPVGGESRYGSWTGPGIDSGDARTAWCYGDPGVAAALVGAGRLTARPAWETAGLDIARRSCARASDRCGVVDSGLCHGSAGLGHLYNRLFQATGADFLAEASRRWYRTLIDGGGPAEGIARFPALTADASGSPVRVVDPGVLCGAAGVVLSLLAAISSIEPGWDRFLLLDAGGSPSA